MEDYEIMPGLLVVIDPSKWRVKIALGVQPPATVVKAQLDLKLAMPGEQTSKLENIFSAESKSGGAT